MVKIPLWVKDRDTKRERDTVVKIPLWMKDRDSRKIPQCMRETKTGKIPTVNDVKKKSVLKDKCLNDKLEVGRI